MAACPGQTQVELDECAGDEWLAADKALNTAYASIMSRLKGNDTVRTRLVAAERAWIGFRDAECAFVGAGVAGGSIQPMIVAQCRTALTKKRQAALTAYLSCQEGDLSCPVPRP
jgi:uncharacterized protein YecT (DUF1311 family)